MTIRIIGLICIPAAMLLVGAAVPQVTGEWPTPSRTINKEGTFWDPAYNNGVPETSWAQHLGVDLKATTRDNVVSPVNGYVISNNTGEAGMTQGKAFIVIKDISTGWEHVLGHISSPLPVCPASKFPKRCPENTRVVAGKTIVGKPMPRSEFAVHVHWGVNTISVAAAMNVFTGKRWKGASGKQWGWGRAPYLAELQMACSLGWINPVNYNRCAR